MQRHAGLIRLALAILGVAAILVSLFADRLGWGVPGSFGRGQVLLALAGLGCIVLAAAGRKATSAYRAVAIVSFNLVVLLAALELAAIVLSRSGMLPSPMERLYRGYERIPYYVEQSWSDTYWREAKSAEAYRYEPYVGWRHRPFGGETIRIDARGVRATPGGECHEASLKIFTFGGSTMWGWGAPDWLTIAAHLQAALGKRLKRDVCIINFAEDGFVSTQGVIALMRQLQVENVPDLVVFYDGTNDVFAGFKSGGVGDHTAVNEMAARYEGGTRPTWEWIESSRLFEVIQSLRSGLGQGAEGSSLLLGKSGEQALDTDYMARRIATTYVRNYEIVGALAESHGF